MEYCEFMEQVKAGVETRMPEAKVELHHIRKNNRVVMDGITILQEGEMISPTIYLNEYYTAYEAGTTLEDTVREILDVYRLHYCQPVFEVGKLKEFAFVRDRVVFKLINFEENRELLKDMPHRRILDLAMVYYFILEDEALGVATAMIFNTHMDLWEIDAEELYRVARENTPKLLGWELQSMDSILQEMLLKEMKSDFADPESYEEFCRAARERETKEASPMYVLTNSERFNGAGCMLYQDVLDKFAKEQNSDLYILPSSIHEVILLPCSQSPDREELCEMVREINETEVAVTDRLSDRVYRYSLDEGILTM